MLHIHQWLACFLIIITNFRPFKREQASEHVVSTVQTCMKQYGVTAEQANEKLRVVIEEAWMDIVEEYLNQKRPMEHYRKTDSCRVSRSLPSARPRALGKDVVCRVPGRGHSAEIWHTACPGVAECRPSANQGTRQRVSFAECWPGGTRQSPSTCPERAPAVRHPSGGLTASTLCRVPPAGTRQR